MMRELEADGFRFADLLGGKTAAFEAGKQEVVVRLCRLIDSSYE
jgi:hypothetical protein